MLVSCYEKKFLILSLLVIILDGIIIYYMPSYFNKINYLYPMLMISLIPFIYLDNKKRYYLYIIIAGAIYDLLYSSILLYNVILFVILISIDIKILEKYNSSLILFSILAFINITIYDTIAFLLIMLTSYQTVSIYDLIYKIDHSILLNIMSVFVYWFLLKKNKKLA